METIEIRAPFQQGMDRLYKSIVDDFRVIRFEAFGQSQFREMETLHAGYFYGQQGPDGREWAPNAPSTIKRKRHGVVLVDKYKLLPAMTRPFADEAVRIVVDEWPKATMIFGNTLPYSSLNNNGVPSRNIPARIHIGLTLPFVDKMTGATADYVREKIKR